VPLAPTEATFKRQQERAAQSADRPS
jgi:hypothetical protein